MLSLYLQRSQPNWKQTKKKQKIVCAVFACLVLGGGLVWFSFVLRIHCLNFRVYVCVYSFAAVIIATAAAAAVKACLALNINVMLFLLLS